MTKGFSAKRANRLLMELRELAPTDQFFADCLELVEDWFVKYDAMMGKLETKGEQQAKRIIEVKMRETPEESVHSALHELGADHECIQ